MKVRVRTWVSDGIDLATDACKKLTLKNSQAASTLEILAIEESFADTPKIFTDG